MARAKRRQSSLGIYHVMTRGNDKNEIFHNEKDYKVYLNILRYANKSYDNDVYAYCIMPNHTHMIIKENEDSLSSIMRTINASYALYYNKEYQHVGHVFQDRFKSQPIEDERYLMSAVRYIHNNPLVAGMAGDRLKYKWSSYRAYVREDNSLVDTEFVLKLFSDKKRKAKRDFIDFSASKDDIILSDIDIPSSYEKDIISGLIDEIIDGEEESRQKKIGQAICRIINEFGFSEKKVADITGLSHYRIRKELKTCNKEK